MRRRSQHRHCFADAVAGAAIGLRLPWIALLENVRTEGGVTTIDHERAERQSAKARVWAAGAVAQRQPVQAVESGADLVRPARPRRLGDRIAPRTIAPADWKRFEHAMGEIFAAFGMDLDMPGTRHSPERYLRALYDSTSGYEGDPKLLTAFPTECRCDADCLVSQISEGPISFYGLCEHHALPFHGFAHIGYIAHERIIGISKLTRLVQLYARRFTVQERLGEQVADALVELMEPHGVAVHLEAVHLCTQMRGVQEEHSKTVTTVWRGGYSDNSELRREFLADVRNRNAWI